MNEFYTLGKEIDVKYEGNKRLFARKCVEYAQEWRAVECENPRWVSKSERKELYKSCRKYVSQCAQDSEERQIYGYFLFILIFGAIITWIVHRMLDIWFPLEGE